jgi:hypothetical protein
MISRWIPVLSFILALDKLSGREEPATTSFNYYGEGFEGVQRKSSSKGLSLYVQEIVHGYIAAGGLRLGRTALCATGHLVFAAVYVWIIVPNNVFPHSGTYEIYDRHPVDGNCHKRALR